MCVAIEAKIYFIRIKSIISMINTYLMVLRYSEPKPDIVPIP